MTPTAFLAQQLRKPSGWFGTHVMARLLNRFNRAINAQTLDLLAVHPTDRVLDVGFGGGDLFGRLAGRAADGFVAGVDFSPEMVARAGRRFRALLAAGRVALHCADAGALPFPDGHFTKACTVNTLYFWEDPARVLGELHRVLAEDGVLVVSFAPKAAMETLPVAAHGFTLYDADAVERLMEAAGFRAVRTMPGLAGRRAFCCTIGTKGGRAGADAEASGA